MSIVRTLACATPCAIAFALLVGGCSGDDAQSSATPAGPGEEAASAPQNEEPARPDEDGGATAPPPAVDQDPPDAGAAADAGPDTTKFYGAARCANAGLVFCDSFEGAAIDQTRWTLEKNGSNTIALDTQQHARGNKSVRLHMEGATNFQYAWLSTTKPFPQLQSHVFGRMFTKIEKLPTKNMHWTSIEIDGPLASGAKARLRYGGEYDDFMANYVTGGEMAKFSKTPVPIAKWTCVEWEYEKATHTMRMWIDEAPLADMTVTDASWVHPTYEKIYVGWQNYQPNLVVPMNVWIDDVALDESRIGCVK